MIALGVVTLADDICIIHVIPTLLVHSVLPQEAIKKTTHERDILNIEETTLALQGQYYACKAKGRELQKTYPGYAALLNEVKPT